MSCDFSSYTLEETEFIANIIWPELQLENE